MIHDTWYIHDQLRTDFSSIATSQSCSGVPLLVGSINCQDVHSGLGLIPSFRQRLCGILVCIYIDFDLSMPTHVQRSVAGCIAAFVDLFRRLCISHCLLPLYYRGWITVTRHWLAYRPACLTDLDLENTFSPKELWTFGMNWMKISCESVRFINSLKNKLNKLYTDESFPALHMSAGLGRPSHVSW